ncbi:MAG: hypothetical protein K0U10_06695 [Gammaproteobacteria bacterium]|nr:hypothetical protein [Gammaproteobacteria bacterium]
MFHVEIKNEADLEESTTTHRLILYVTPHYPYYEQKRNAILAEIEDGELYNTTFQKINNNNMIETGRVKIIVHPSKNCMDMAWFMVKRHVDEEKGLLRGKGLILLNYLVQDILKIYPNFINSNPIINLDAMPLDTDTGECTTDDWVRFLETDVANNLFNKGRGFRQDDLNYLYSLLRDEYSEDFFRRNVRFELKQYSDSERDQYEMLRKAKRLFALLCEIYKTKNLVKYYQSLSFTITDDSDPTRVVMMTSLNALLVVLGQKVVLF